MGNSHGGRHDSSSESIEVIPYSVVTERLGPEGMDSLRALFAAASTGSSKKKEKVITRESFISQFAPSFQKGPVPVDVMIK